MNNCAHHTYSPTIVEVFRTNILHQRQASRVLELLCREFPAFRINMDLSDCDKILRVEGQKVLPEKIIEVVTSSGYECCVLE